MTYSNDQRIRELAEQHGLQVEEIEMHNTRYVQQQELLIGRDLRWLDSV